MAAQGSSLGGLRALRGERPRGKVRVGVDVGGTFTDIVCIGQDGRVVMKKISSTVDNYGRAIAKGLEEIFAQAGWSGAAVREVVHGTTVVTNAILQQRGAKTALLTTRGFRDVLELRRVRVPEMYNLDWDKPPDLVERALRFEVDERMSARGEVLVPLDEASVRAVVPRLKAEGVESVAVCLLNAYADDRHERRVGAILREALPGAALTLSTDILREAKEYERTATAVINAYVLPLVDGYMEDLTRELAQVRVAAPLLIMQSNGGILTAPAAKRKPVFIIESGPAAGVIASDHLARRQGIGNVITFDMGGTTAKASIIEDGELSRASEYEVGAAISLTSRLIKGGGHLIRVPVIDIAEVGAGGGSIAWIDAGGALQVGPRSAGANPGPVCYGIGGTALTVTDANVVLGYINPEVLVGGDVRLDPAKAREALEAQVARPLKLDPDRAAYGVHQIANANMMRAIRAVSTERGRDPRGFTLFAFGGSGPVHAAGMARSLEMRRVIVPPSPGLFSAFGLLFADVMHHYVQTFFHRTREADLAAMTAALTDMERQARATLADEGYPGASVEIRRSADLRYSNQCFELTIPMPGGPVTPRLMAEMERRYNAEHEKTYGHRAGAAELIDIVNLRVTGRGRVRKPRLIRPAVARSDGRPPVRSAYFGPEAGRIESPVLRRGDLGARPRPGPLLIEEYDSTTVVPPGCRASGDGAGNIVIEIGAGRRK